MHVAIPKNISLQERRKLEFIRTKKKKPTTVGYKNKNYEHFFSNN